MKPGTSTEAFRRRATCRPPPAAGPGRVVVSCRLPPGTGAGEALALTERVAVRLRDLRFGRFRLGTPSVEIDGRDPDGVRAVVVLPVGRDGPS